MDIRLKARLSAYSKIDSVDHLSSSEAIRKDHIDSLFEGPQQPLVVSKEDISHELFPDLSRKNHRSVKECEIDKLFM